MNRWPAACGVLGLLVHSACSEPAFDSGSLNTGDAGANGEAGGHASEAGEAGLSQTGGEAGLGTVEDTGGGGGTAGSGMSGGGTSSGGTAGGATSGGGTAGGGTSGGGTASGGTSGGGSGGGGGGAPLTACNDVPSLGVSITTTKINPGAPPVLTQGTIHAGLYVQTAQAYYGITAPPPQTATGSTVRITVVGQTATLQFDSLETALPETMQIVMSQPTTALPQSVEIVCEPADAIVLLNTPLTYITYQASNTQFQFATPGALSTYTLQPG